MKAVIFDLDGTLLDVREGFYYQFQALTEEFDGAPASRMAIKSAAHGTTEEIVRTLVQNKTVSFDDICRRHEQLRLDAYNRFLTLYSGVDELLPILQRMGIHVAALTSGNKLTVACLDRLGIGTYFDVVISAEHVMRPKPHPEGIEIILQTLAVDARDVAIVGDTVVDILAGKNAALGKAIGVSHGFGNVRALEAAGADHIIHDIPSLLDVLE